MIIPEAFNDEQLAIEFPRISAVYCELMTELKLRIEVIDNVIAKRLRLRKIIALELCCLQLRMICEVIALGCLVAHGELRKAKASLETEYAAHRIMKHLERMHSDFYPRPGEQVRDPATGIPVALKDITDGFLNKTEFLSLYGRLGDVLHAGNIKEVQPRELGMTFEEVLDYRNKIMRLLNHHQIALLNSKHQMWVLMESEQDGKVQTFLMQQL